jgi:pSer/pThr/pTyr-binding forkhead associated (FHA) protein
MTLFARLISLNQAPGGARQVLSLKNKETILGREKGCKIRIPSNAISRQHCRLGVKNDMVVVEDLGSSNGTYVNEQRISEMCYLKPGDVLRVGPFRFLVHYQLSEEAIHHLIEILTIAPTTADESVDVELLDDVG